MRSSSGGTWVAGSERPVPRLSHTTTRMTSASCSMTAVNGLAGSSYISTLLNQPGIQTSVVSPCPNSRYASRTSPLRAYRTRSSLTRPSSHFMVSTRINWPRHRRSTVPFRSGGTLRRPAGQRRSDNPPRAATPQLGAELFAAVALTPVFIAVLLTP